MSGFCGTIRFRLPLGPSACKGLGSHQQSKLSLSKYRQLPICLPWMLSSLHPIPPRVWRSRHKLQQLYKEATTRYQCLKLFRGLASTSDRQTAALPECVLSLGCLPICHPAHSGLLTDCGLAAWRRMDLWTLVCTAVLRPGQVTASVKLQQCRLATAAICIQVCGLRNRS